MKRFAVKSITRDREYLASKNANSKVLYFSANPNGEAEVVKVMLKPRARLKKLSWELDFSTLDIKGRGAMGNLLTKYSVHRISMKEKGVSTLKGQKIWFDRDVLRLNTEGRGDLLGEFKADDKIFVLNKKGFYRTTGYDLSNRYSNDLLRIEKLNKDKILTVIYFDNDVNKEIYLNRLSEYFI